MEISNEKVLSVSVAAYNVEATLRQALDPFTKCRNARLLDIMIIDDGGTDGTAAIAKEYERKYPGVFRFIHKENGGWGSVLNTGMDRALGKYYKHLDGDDYFSDENLDDFIEFLVGCDADIVHSPFVSFDDRTGAVLHEMGVYTYLPKRTTLRISELSDFIPHMHTLAVRTELLRSNPFRVTEHCYYADVDFFLKVCNFAETMSYYELPIYYYRMAQSGQSMSTDGVRKHYREHLKVLYGLLQYEREHVTQKHMKAMFRARLIGMADMQYVFFYALQCNRAQKKELQEFEQTLKEKYPFYYETIQHPSVRFLRKTNFFGYRIVGHLRARTDRKLKRYIWGGC